MQKDKIEKGKKKNSGFHITYTLAYPNDVPVQLGFGSSGICTNSIIEDAVFDSCGGIVGSSFFPGMILHGNGPLFYNCKITGLKRGITITQDGGPGTPWFLNCSFEGSKSIAAVIEGYPVFMNCNFTHNTDVGTSVGGDPNLP